MHTSSNINQTSYNQLLEDILEKGKQVHVQVNGMSMFPWLLPKDEIVIEPTDYINVKVGSIALYKGQSNWIAHRIVKTDGNAYTLRGDGNLKKDLPVNRNEIKGIVVGVTKSRVFWSNWAVSKCGKLFALLSPITAPLFWLMGRVAVCMWSIIKKVRD